MLQLKLYLRLTYEWLRQFLRQPGQDGVDRFILAAYRAYLKRNPDPEGSRTYGGQLRSKALSPRGVLREIIKSGEFLSTYDLPHNPIMALHLARKQLVRTQVPRAQDILDLGGAAVGRPEGSLLAMGYPHHPRRITIVDLPPADRLHGGPGAEQAASHTTPRGTRVDYLYRSMTDLDSLPDASVDLVFSGESIEHISQADGEIVCRHAFRLLRPGGAFCLDTPNGRLTRIQSPDAFIHPEHQVEYRPAELRDMLLRHGFRIAAQKGICPMPQAIASGQFNLREMALNARLCDDPDVGYLFFIHAVKLEAGG